MKVSFKRISNIEHELKIERQDGSIDSVICETRSLFIHDLTHFAVEIEAGVRTGFWGLLASGKTLDDLNDRTGKSIQSSVPELMLVERTVAILQGLAKDKSVDSIMESMSPQPGMTLRPPEWFNRELVMRVDKRLKDLKGHWNATAFGQTMELFWEHE